MLAPDQLTPDAIEREYNMRLHGLTGPRSMWTGGAGRLHAMRVLAETRGLDELSALRLTVLYLDDLLTAQEQAAIALFTTNEKDTEHRFYPSPEASEVTPNPNDS